MPTFAIRDGMSSSFFVVDVAVLALHQYHDSFVHMPNVKTEMLMRSTRFLNWQSHMTRGKCISQTT